MSTVNAIKNLAIAKVTQICEEWKNKEIPNWAKMGDMHAFGFRVTEGELNFQITLAIYPVEEPGPGNFLVHLQTAFMSTPVQRAGYEILQVPIGPAYEFQYAMKADDEPQLQNNVLQLIQDEAENILCQILE